MISPKFKGMYVNKNEIKTKPFVYPVPFVGKKENLAFKESQQISRMENEILQYQEHRKMVDEFHRNREFKSKIEGLQKLIKEKFQVEYNSKQKIKFG